MGEGQGQKVRQIGICSHQIWCVGQYKLVKWSDQGIYNPSGWDYIPRSNTKNSCLDLLYEIHDRRKLFYNHKCFNWMDFSVYQKRNLVIKWTLQWWKVLNNSIFFSLFCLDSNLSSSVFFFLRMIIFFPIYPRVYYVKVAPLQKYYKLDWLYLCFLSQIVYNIKKFFCLY